MDGSTLEFVKEDGRIYANGDDGSLLCEVKFTETENGVVNIHRTYVDKSLGGQGIAGKLVTMAVEDIEAKGLTPDATCSYAAKWLEKNRPNLETTASKTGPSCSL
ncbi:MAG: N-acetyltransferase [Atopobiaceae bacterium]|nr:N-acetyltransferase [Atopobiaceae bacterium]